MTMPTADDFLAYEAVARADVNYWLDRAVKEPRHADYYRQQAQQRKDAAEFYAFQASELSLILPYEPRRNAA